MEQIVIATEEQRVVDEIVRRLVDVPLIDKYEAYQLFYDRWKIISNDLERIRSEGQAVITQVDPHKVSKKKGDDEVDVQDGWEGHLRS